MPHVAVCKMHVCEIYACEMHAYEMHAHEMHTYEMHAHEMHAHEIHALPDAPRNTRNAETIPGNIPGPVPFWYVAWVLVKLDFESSTSPT
jgi:hypothetical protein